MWGNRIDNWLDGEGSLLPYGFFRMILGLMLWRHAWLFLENHIRLGFYTNRFYLPYFDWYPLPSEGFYIFLLVVIILCGVFLLVGYKERQAAIVAFAFVTFHFFLNQIWYRHNRYFLILLLLLLAIGPLTKVFSMALKPSVTAIGRTWTFFMIRLQMTITYLASAIAKTLDPDWRSGNVMQNRIGLKNDGKSKNGDVVPSDVADQVPEILSREQIGDILTFFALLQEYFLAICLWIPPTRKLAIWVGVIFHGAIEFSAQVLVFSYAVLATYFVVIRPTTKDRKLIYNPAIKSHLLIARLVYHLDWLNKVAFHPTDGDHILVVDKNDRSYRGWVGLAILGSCMVIPYLVAYPITWLKHLGIGKVEESSFPEGPEEEPTINTYVPGRVLALVVLILVAYQGFVLLVAADIIDLRFSAIRFFDLGLFLLMLFLVVTFYRSRFKQAIS